jgi:nickel transport protein
VNVRRSLKGPKILWIFTAALLGISLATFDALAHKVNLFAYVEGDRVIVEGYFSASSRAQDCLVQVFDERGKIIHSGKTDTKGIFSFRLQELPDFTGGLKIVLEAGMGHKTEYTLSASDIPKPRQEEQPKESRVPVNEPKDAARPAALESSPPPDGQALTAAIEKIMDRKLEPIVGMLSNQQKLLLEEKHSGPSVQEIIGGIGWIIGMVGIAAFLSARNRADKATCDKGR